jgi:hypothetical protein
LPLIAIGSVPSFHILVSPTRKKNRRMSYHGTQEPANDTAYGWLGAPKLMYFAPDEASMSAGICRVKAHQKLWSDKGPRTVSKGH